MDSPTSRADLRTVAALAAHEWRLQRRDLSALVVFTIMPVALMAFMMPTYTQAMGGRPGAEQAVPGMAVMFAMFLISHVGLVFFREHGWNTWARYRSTAIPMWVLVAGKTIGPCLLIIVQLTVVLSCGRVLFGLRVNGSLLAMSAVVAMFALCLIAVALLGVMLCRTIMQMTTMANVLAMVFAGLGGAIVPLELLPQWAVPAAPFVPSYWAVRGMREVASGAGLLDVLPTLAVLGVFTTVFAVVALLVFRPEHRKVSWS